MEKNLIERNPNSLLLSSSIEYEKTNDEKIDFMYLSHKNMVENDAEWVRQHNNIEANTEAVIKNLMLVNEKVDKLGQEKQRREDMEEEVKAFKSKVSYTLIAAFIFFVLFNALLHLSDRIFPKREDLEENSSSSIHGRDYLEDRNLDEFNRMGVSRNENRKKAKPKKGIKPTVMSVDSLNVIPVIEKKDSLNQ